MKPADIGLPARFTKFRPQQEEALWRDIRTPKRFIGHGMPTGSGKTLTYMAAAALEAKERVVVLTSTKGLANQLNREFKEMFPADIRGQGNYLCAIEESGEVTVDQGVCHAGVPCILKLGGCSYYDAERRASRARIVFTNYAYWLYSNTYGRGLGRFDRLILDEAHAAPEHLASFLSVFIGHREADGEGLGAPPPQPARWRRWAADGLRGAQARLERSRSSVRRGERGAAIRSQHYESQVKRLEQIARAAPSAWVMEEVWGGWRWDCVWPGAYGKKLLFCTGDKVSLYSATVRPKTLALLGLKEEEYEFWEYDSTFPEESRRLIWVPTARVTRKSSHSDIGHWLSRITEIVGGRSDRKGIVHAVSYERARLITDSLRRAGLPQIVTHNPDTTEAAVEFFRKSPPGTTLVSPSLGTGYDFPYKDCEYQIIAKIPFPEKGSKIVQAREAQDPSYSAYTAMIELVQACGRGLRAKDDRCENIIIDDNIGWFKNKYRGFAPRWFISAIERQDRVPRPPPRLT